MRLAPASLAMMIAMFSLAFPAKAQSNECPKTSTVGQAGPAPPGWRSWRSSETQEFKLRDIAFSDGPPDDRIFINPLASSRNKSARIDSYDFASPTFGSIWLICQYEGTDISLVKETDNRGKRCAVSFVRRGSKQIVDRISCH